MTGSAQECLYMHPVAWAILLYGCEGLTYFTSSRAVSVHVETLTS